MKYDIRSGDFTFKHVCDCAPVASRKNYVEHFHTVYEILYFLKGDTTFVIRHKTYRLRPHNLLVVRPGEPHYIDINHSVDYERIVLRFDATSLPSCLQKGLDSLQNVYVIDKSPLSLELLRLSNHYAQLRDVSEAYLLAAFQGSLSIILSYLMAGREKVQKADFADKEMKHIISYIDTHLTEIQSVEELCSELHLSRSAIQNRFRANLRTSVMTYIRTRRCMLANSLLRSGMIPTKVYSQCGFTDYSTFYRVYVKTFRCSPSEHLVE